MTTKTIEAAETKGKQNGTVPRKAVARRHSDVVAQNNGDGSALHSALPEKSIEDVADEVRRYSGLAEGRASRIGVWVRCTLPTYDDLWVLFRTSNPTRVAKTRPLWAEPFELRKLRRDVALAEIEYRAAGPDKPESLDLEDKWVKLLTEATERQNAYSESYHKLQSAWLANYVMDVDPWPYEDVPHPDPSDPDSYFALYHEMEDFYVWCVEAGYELALAYSVKN